MARSSKSQPNNPRRSRSSVNKSRVFSAPKSNHGVKSSKPKSQGSAPHTRRKGSRNDTDIYEYAPDTVRRSKIKLDLDKDEAMDVGGLFAEDGGLRPGFEDTKEELRAKLIGEFEDGEGIESGDDEEIDSDAAFDESDDERFAGFFSSKKKLSKSKTKKQPQVRFAEVDLNEDSDGNGQHSSAPSAEEGEENSEEEEEESGEDDEFLDVLDVLDGRAKLYLEEDDGSPEDRPESGPSHGHSSPPAPGRLEDSDAESGSEGGVEQPDDEDNNSAFAPSDEEDADIGRLEELHTFISGLETTSKKRKNAEDGGPQIGAPPRKRRVVREKAEAGAENEFGISSVGTKLNLDDLLGPLATQSSSLLSLKKATKALASSSKVKTLSAPLPQRTQERLDREAAYVQTKEEVQKWSETMKRIREAEHLSFPLQAEPSGRVSNLELVAKFKPTTSLETAVDKLLKSAKLRDQDIPETEDAMLQANNLSVQEVAQRRAELRKMRELMLRAELKARRANKIKSKTYRKLKRKEREKLGEKINEEGSDEESRMQQEIDRARERATLKHKHTGKWAKQMKGRHEGDTRKDIEEMLDRGEKLRRKIRGLDSDQSQAEGDDSDSDNEDGDEERIRQDAFDELKGLKHNEGLEDSGEKKKGKSIFEMKFMKDAMARQQQATNKLIDDFVQEMGGETNSLEDMDDLDDAQHIMPEPSGVVAVRAGGRVVYRPGALHPSISRTMVRPMGSLASDTSSVTLMSTDLLSPPASPEQQQRPTVPLPSDDENPWLSVQDTNSSKAPRKHNEVIVGKESNLTEKSKNKLKKATKKLEGAKEKAIDDATVEISMDHTLGSTSQTARPSTRANKFLAGKQVIRRDQSGDEGDSDVNSEVDAQEKYLSRKGKEPAHGVSAFEQRDLVALAFAGDNVVQEFEAAKQREIAADAPHEVDTTLPGWGAWGGVGTRRLPPKPHLIKKVAGVDPKSRADYGKAHVTISEKRDKKAAKYLVKDLPYPYTSKAQFERSMDRPLGKEWNTRVGFQRGTLPKVVKKMGVIIDPLEKVG